jgi:hypothetical protein
MTNVYDGAPDSRQSTDVNEPVSRFRPRYRALTDEEKALHDAIKDKAVELETLFARITPNMQPRYLSLAYTSLEQAIMWAVKQLTA